MDNYDGPERRVVATSEIVEHVRKADKAVHYLSIAMIVVLFVGLAAMVTMTGLALKGIKDIEEANQQNVSDHRVRNELLHECIVDLIYAVVTSDPDMRGRVPNPCPQDETPVEIPSTGRNPLEPRSP